MAKSTDNTTTPLMKQYQDFKVKYPDCILLYRVGDFYETFGQDAIDTSKILNIVLTKRSGKGQDCLAGFPHHSLETYLPKFIEAGRRVAIVDQIEDPKLAKGIVKRGVSEIVTPGISYGDNNPNPQKGNYLCAIHRQKDRYGVAFIDISTGEFLVSEGSKMDVDKLLKDFDAKELVLQRNEERTIKETFQTNILTKVYDDWVFTLTAAQDILSNAFGVSSMKGFGIEDMSLAIVAAGAAMHYIQETGHEKLSHICNIARIDNSDFVWMDNFTIRNLEIVFSVNGEKSTLYNILNQTQTNMGARLLRQWLLLPLKNKQDIEKRQTIISSFVYDDQRRQQTKTTLSAIGDMEKLISKLSTFRIQPNELYNFAHVLDNIALLKQILEELQIDTNLTNKLKDFSSLKEFIISGIDQDAPNNITKGNVIKKGYNQELDEYREIAYNSTQVLERIRQEQADKTGITNLKIGYNNIFGYYLEVTNLNKNKVPENWQRKQTLVNCERYIIDELKEIETKIINAQDNISTMETSLYRDIVQKCIPYIRDLQITAGVVASIDCLLSLAIVALENNYTRPQLLQSDILYILQGRHPVIEKMLPIDQNYIASDVYLDTTTQQIVILTGPNMSGKSAYLRQTALIVILAQIGSYVPAKRAEIGIVDKIFTRVGATDNIASGESTFMVEMNETASILNNLSPHSLILLDEIGRGTSTYDGVSIAWAIAAYLHDNKNKAKVLFATHYHELIDMEKQFKRIKNYHIAIKEIGKKIIFLRTIVKGGSSQSFGIHVAGLAGLPKQVLETAQNILTTLEAQRKLSLDLSDGTIAEGEKNTTNKETITSITRAKSNTAEQTYYQTSFIKLDDPILLQIKENLLRLDIDNLTPIQALNELNKIKNLLK